MNTLTSTEGITLEPGCLIDGSHWSAQDLDYAIIQLAESAGWKGNKLEEYAFDSPAEHEEELRYEAEDALAWLNEHTAETGLSFTVTDNCLFYEFTDEQTAELLLERGFDLTELQTAPDGRPEAEVTVTETLQIRWSGGEYAELVLNGQSRDVLNCWNYRDEKVKEDVNRDSLIQRARQWLKAIQTGTTIDVCLDCYLKAQGFNFHPSDSREPLSLIPAETEITDGCLNCPSCSHYECSAGPACQCAYADRGHGFSWTACEGCGSTLGGARQPLTLWTT